MRIAYIIDIIVICFIVSTVVTGYKQGLLKSFVRLVGQIVSLFITYASYPVVSKFVREHTGIFNVTQSYIAKSLNIEGLIINSTKKVQTDFINSMRIPDFLKSALVENNNPVIYNTLNATGISDYISGFLANICINIISMIAVFIIVQVIIEVLSGMSGLISRMPLVGEVNRLLGGALGFLQGLLGVWIMLVVLTFFIAVPIVAPIFEMIEKTFATKLLYENNILWFMILKVFA